jgi:hypothetical protein
VDHTIAALQKDLRNREKPSHVAAAIAAFMFAAMFIQRLLFRQNSLRLSRQVYNIFCSF